ncbi:MAG: CmpA/NrtA family ABC transporter substrate-binding protein [Pseudomonadota bacterium]
MTELKIAYVPLTDAAPLIVAKEKGFFAAHDLDVQLIQEQSWASVRDKLQTERVDVAQMLASMPLALAAGASYTPMDLTAGMVLSLNGNAITVSSQLYSDMERTGLLHDDAIYGPGRALKAVVELRKSLKKQPLCFASVFPTSTHYYLLRYWMAASGIDTDNDIRFVVIPPPRMVEALQSGLIDGCCVGEPWNHHAVSEFAGQIILTGFDIWHNAPEKVLAVRTPWLEANRDIYTRLIHALLEAGACCDASGHREEVSLLLSDARYLDVPTSVIQHSLAGRICDVAHRTVRTVPEFHIFNRYSANLPWPSQATWLLDQMMRWQQLPENIDVDKIARRVFRQDVFREAAALAGVSCPPDSIHPDHPETHPDDIDLGSRGFMRNTAT